MGIKNQVLCIFHSPNSLPYQSSKDAIEKISERCTAVGVRLLKEGNMETVLPHFGNGDIYQYRVWPTLIFSGQKPYAAVKREFEELIRNGRK